MILEIQRFRNRKWHSGYATCGFLNSFSKISNSLNLGQAKRASYYRIRADYVRRSGDKSNLNTHSPWFYFTVRK